MEASDRKKHFGPSISQWASRERTSNHRDHDSVDDKATRSLPDQAAAGKKSGARQIGRRHYTPTKDTLFQVGSEDVDHGVARGRARTSKGREVSLNGSIEFSRVDRSSTPSRRNGGSSWAESLRETHTTGQWKPTMTIPRGPSFRTSSRSRSTSVRSSTPCCATPESAGTSRERGESWQKSLREHSEGTPRYQNNSVECTPSGKKKRRSLGTWWSEIEPHRRKRISTPEIRSLSLGDDDGEISIRSVTSPAQSASVAAQLNSISRTSKRLLVERKRQELNESENVASLSNSRLILEPSRKCPSMQKDGLSVGSTSEDCLRSLRRGRSSPPSHEAAKSDLRVCPKPRSSQPLKDQHCRTPRERAAIERHLQRAASRSQSTQRSASATPERVTASKDRSRKIHSVQGAKISPGQRSHSATPERLATSRVQSVHQQDTNNKTCPKRCATKSIAEKPLSSPGCTSSCARDRFTRPKSARRPHAFAKENCALQGEDKGRAGIAKLTECSPDTAEYVAAAKELCQNEAWVRQAANPHERAERRRDVAKSKCDKALAHEKSRVFVFRRPLEPSSALNSV
mmetsp:Transcript_108953/g.172120  ORF Transcript_108953/g.172120 Transcript_108953/m.172120 type:complete len:572 (+) Transcript_108953:55-1770(+)